MSQTKAQIDKLLTNAMSAYIPTGFVSEMLLPKLDVIQWSGKLGKLTHSFLRVQNTLIGGRGAARRVDVVVRETDSYQIDAHG
jgi:hypothetical protein